MTHTPEDLFPFDESEWSDELEREWRNWEFNHGTGLTRGEWLVERNIGGLEPPVLND